MTAFFVFFFPILLYLGSWQVIRGLEKKDIVNQHYENKSLPVVNESEMFKLTDDKLTYRTVNLMENSEQRLIYSIIDCIDKKRAMRFSQPSKHQAMNFF